MQKNRVNIFGSFLDIRQNAEWPRFYWPIPGTCKGYLIDVNIPHHSILYVYTFLVRVLRDLNPALIMLCVKYIILKPVKEAVTMNRNTTYRWTENREHCRVRPLSLTPDTLRYRQRSMHTRITAASLL